MFKKPKDVELGAANLLSGKDVKKFLDQVCLTFSGINKDILANSLGIIGKCKLQKIKLPKKVVLFSIQLPTSLEDLNKRLEKIFPSSKKTLELFIDINGRMNLIPTFAALVLLFQNEPKPCLRNVFIPQNASKFVLNGADVMLPGIIRYTEDTDNDCYGIGHFKKGDRVCIFSYGNPIPFAVGKFLVDSQTAINKGFTGKGIEVLHSYGDELWNKCFKIIPNEGYKEDIVRSINGNQKGINSNDTINNNLIESTKVIQLESDQDALLYLCFKKSILNLKKENFPLLVSYYYSNVLLKSRPVGVTIDLKKTKFKKISIFLQHLQEEGLLQLEEENDILKIQSIDEEAISVYDFGIDTNLNWEAKHTVLKSIEKEKELENQKLNQGKHKIVLEDFYKPNKSIYNRNESFKLIFTDYDINSFYTIPQIREVLFTYIKRENLDFGESIQLNPVLANLLQNKVEHSTNIKKSVAWKSFLNTFNYYHRIKKFDGSQSKIMRGEPKKIEITTKNRQGRKAVTIITRIDSFGINPVEFAEKIQRKFSCSSKAQKIASNSETWEVVVQGRKVKEVVKYLESEYLLVSKFIKAC